MVEPGFYWARWRSFEWWNLIVQVYDKPPFMKIQGWDLSRDKFKKDIDHSDIVFGPKIEEYHVSGQKSDVNL